jgi:hypothetical protein
MGLEPFKQREKLCKQFGFECKCKLCELDRKDRNLKLRERLVEEKNQKLLKKLSTEQTSSMKEVNEFVKQIGSLYEGDSARDEDLKLDLYYPLMLQAQFYLKSVEIEKSASVFMKIFDTFKYTHEYYAIISLFEAVEAFYYGSMNEEAIKCLKVARNNFIGHTEDFNYMVKKRFSEIEEFSDFLKAI